jgi:hypothetical protein
MREWRRAQDAFEAADLQRATIRRSQIPTLAKSAMETNQIRRSLEDLTERNEALRRFL